MFVARSFGLPIIPEIDPWSRSPLMRLFPWRKSTTPRRATYPIAKRISHDSDCTALTPLTQLIISTKTITTFEVDVGEGAQAPPGQTENGAVADHDQGHEARRQAFRARAAPGTAGD